MLVLQHGCADEATDINNNNNKGSRGIGEVVTFYGVDCTLVLTNPDT
jgi:hypothetical protein